MANIKQILDDEGCIVIDQFLNQDIANDLTKRFSELEEQSDPASANAVVEKRGVKFARRNILSLEFVQHFISSEKVAALLGQIDENAVPARAILFDKTGDANWTVPWHQDRSIAVQQRIDVPGFGPWSEKSGVVHVQPPESILNRMFTLRFSLDTCDADNGPLRVILRSHHQLLSQDQADHLATHQPQLSCITGIGGVVVMRPLILHASSPAKIVRHRRVLHIEFGPTELPGGLKWAMA